MKKLLNQKIKGGDEPNCSVKLSSLIIDNSGEIKSRKIRTKTAIGKSPIWNFSSDLNNFASNATQAFAAVSLDVGKVLNVFQPINTLLFHPLKTGQKLTYIRDFEPRLACRFIIVGVSELLHLAFPQISWTFYQSRHSKWPSFSLFSQNSSRTWFNF